MAISVLKVNEYIVECDKCGFEEVYHTGDMDNGITVHSIVSAMKAAKFHKCQAGVLCSICYEGYTSEKANLSDRGRRQWAK